MKPNFIIVGAQKCATTSVWAYLREHPGIHVANEKELRFFDGYMWDYGFDWYENNFLPEKDAMFEGPFMEGKTPVGEASPIYIHTPEAIPRIATYNPAMKIIIMLRDPVRRAISNYWWSKRMTNETLPLMEALHAEDGRNGISNPFYHYKAWGKYVEYLEQIYAWFPAEQVLIGRQEDLHQRPADFMHRVTAFLETVPWYGYSFTRFLEQDYPGPGLEVLNYLASYFAPYNKQLVQKFSVDTSGWLA
ncbi:MAG: sulfotransferase family protein [Candidatus Thorarchaeota archaeon]|jgi:hypothetical protein